MHLFTSESVTSGHPDKLCDQISDAVLDAYLAQDPESHVACEVFIAPNTVVIGGEVKSKAFDAVNVEDIARRVLLDVGYNSEEAGIDGFNCRVINLIGAQSPDIDSKVMAGLGATESKCHLDKQGAGDQGIMFGYACIENLSDCMPLPITMAHELAYDLEMFRRANPQLGLLPDGKTQVTLKYDGAWPVAVDTILVSTQHKEEVDLDKIREAIEQHVIWPTLSRVGTGGKNVVSPLDINNVNIMVNPVGRFVIGGPAADTGLTGRKIIVDTYGGMGRHGGGCFSGKDASKVDRTGAYVARHIAKSIVSSEMASRCEVQLAYAIGVARPVSVMVDTFGTETTAVSKILDFVNTRYDLRPAAIIERFGLKKPQFQMVSTYGHFGTMVHKHGDTPVWEDLSK